MLEVTGVSVLVGLGGELVGAGVGQVLAGFPGVGLVDHGEPSSVQEFVAVTAEPHGVNGRPVIVEDEHDDLEHAVTENGASLRRPH